MLNLLNGSYTKILILVLSTLLVHSNTTLTAQTNTYSKASDSDAKAIATINAIKKKYSNSSQLITSSFSLKMEFPGQNTRLEKGTMTQHGKKFKLDVKDMAIINDGKSVWFINKEQKEVQINDYTPNSEQGILNPSDFLEKYDHKNYVAATIFNGPKNGKNIHVIECKPVQKNTEYSKIRITVDAATNQLSLLEIFNKDGSRHYLTISKTTFSKPTDGQAFVFSKSNYPGFHIEDLRVN